MQFTSRFRERTIIGRDNLASGSVLGKLERFNKQNVKVSSQNLTSGTALPTKIFEKCWDEKHLAPFHGDTQHGGPLYKVKATLPGGSWVDVSFTTKGFSVPGLPDGDYFVYRGKIGNPLFSGDNTTQLQYATAGFAAPYNTIFINSQVEAYGGEAYSSLRPRLERGGAGQFLIELRDLPKMLRQSAKGFHDVWKSLGGSQTSSILHPKQVAGHFLNHQFGWVPFISDINKMIEVTIFSDQFIRDLVSSNDVWMRRTHRLKNTETRSLVTLNSISSGCEPLGLSVLCKPEQISGSFTTGWHEVYKVISDTVWASGQFKFYRPEFDSSLQGFDGNFNKLKQLMILHGLRINPSLLYKVTPWTWLIDWFSNTGKIIDDIGAAAEDGVVARNLYVMEHTEYIIEHLSHFNLYTGPRTFSWKRIVDSEQRVRAGSAFGFISPSQLSGRQISILGALGVDRTFH